MAAFLSFIGLSGGAGVFLRWLAMGCEFGSWQQKPL
jgi:hypothetical protein